MKVNRIPEDQDALSVMAAPELELSSAPDSRAALRAGVAAVRSGRDGNLVVVAGAMTSAAGRPGCAPARNKLNWTEQQLRRRMARGLAELTQLLDTKDILKIVDFVLSISASCADRLHQESGEGSKYPAAPLSSLF